MRRPATSRPLRDAGLALTLLTCLPLRVRVPESGRADVAGYFPAAGALLGLLALGFVYLPVRLGIPFVVDRSAHALLFATLTVVLWAALTRLLHWDALADVADAYWGSHDPVRRLEIMRDPHVGAFGVAALVLVALTQVSAVSVLLLEGALVGLVAAPVIARYSAVAGAWLGTPVRESGLAAAVAGRPRAASAVFASAVLAATLIGCAAASGESLAVAVVSVALALVIAHLLAARFGGVTGDVLGASILLTETASLVLFALVS